MAALLVIGGAALGGCASAGTAAPGSDKPARVESVAGTEAKKVVLTEQAVGRLGIRTETVSLAAATSAGGGTQTRSSLPYSALLYDTQGVTWVFEEVEPRSYLRRKVDVEVVDGDTVIMRAGPPLAAHVVTVGAAMLYSTELGTGS